MRRIKYGLFLLILSCAAVCPAISARAGDIYTSPYVTFAPDGRAWTVDRPLEEGTGHGVYRFWYSSRDDFRTGLTSKLRGLLEGEHYYDYPRTGSVPVGEWRVMQPYARCIQGLGVWSGGSIYHGVQYGPENCRKPYYSGWVAYCADCGRSLSMLMYMGKEAVRTLSVLDTDMDYYYLCPNPGCRHLEQGRAVGAHSCREISYNRYRVVYMGNGDSEYQVRGEMPPSFHMYNNETVFEGNAVTPIRTLTLNGYTRKGFRFTGWNTEPDGTGTFYADGAQILNLTALNYDMAVPRTGTVVLYAQWERVDSSLFFDAKGGIYGGENPVVREYGDRYVIDGEKGEVIPPAGYKVSFDVRGGVYIPPVTSTRTFLRWEILEPVHGILEDNVYTFLGGMGDEDRMEAVYSLDPIILPTPERDNQSFGGWYSDEALTRPVGDGGDAFTPAGDTTLYAGWVDLRLRSTENYTDNDGKGAVDLVWFQQDNMEKTYRLYQSVGGEDGFFQIFGAEDTASGGGGLDLALEYGGNADKRFLTIPSSGFYFLTANGAQGGSFGSRSGGKGGCVSGKFYLKEGEILTFQLGGRDGSNGGGKASAFGGGGGMTMISSNLKGVLLIAGGGGGATSSEDGQAGGSGSNTVETGHTGESGMAGGGGGCLGGLAGEHIVHHHDAGCMKSISSPAPAAFYSRMTWSGENIYDYNPRSGDSYAMFRVHTKARREEGCWYEFQAGDRGAFFGIPGKGTLSMELSFSDWGEEDVYFRGVEITVISAAGSVIANRTIGDNLDKDAVVSEEIICEDNGQKYSRYIYTKHYSEAGFTGTGIRRPKSEHVHRDGGSHGIARSIDLSGVFTVEVPENVGGVYIICRTKYQPSGNLTTGVWTETWISNVRYSYSGYGCGYEEGQIISSRPGYGGSNYINAAYAVTQNNLAGVRGGDGSAHIKGELVGLSDGHELKGVAAADTEAPYPIREEYIFKEPSGDGGVLVRFEPVEDQGTEYYFKAQSYCTRTGRVVCTSNITRNLLLTGVKGYLYLVDTDEGTKVTESNAINSDQPLTEPVIEVPLEPYPQYLHIAAIDNAGNVSEPVHVEISWDVQVAWRLSTDQIRISGTVGGRDYGNVYPAQGDNAYYVRADGAAPFLLSFDSLLHGFAREDYQVNYQIFRSVLDSGQEQSYITTLPYTVPLSSTEALDVTEYIRWTEGSVILEDAAYIGGVRSDSAKKLEFGQAFTLQPNLHGKTITVTPTAGASFEDVVYYSDAHDDAAHGIRLTGDGEPPVITGLDAFRPLDLIDRNEDGVTLEIKAWDKLSGIREFTLTIENKDNACQAVYLPDENGVIQLEITKDDPIFNGNLLVTAYAVDHVGNEAREDWHVTEFALDTRVQRILPPHEPVFKRGESGILDITTWGYAEYVEVEFPDFLSEYNKTFLYTDCPDYRKEEQIQFMIPLYAPEGGDYTITVRAYKGDKRLEDHPSISAIRVDGTILDELRTRLR